MGFEVKRNLAILLPTLVPALANKRVQGLDPAGLESAIPF